MINVFLTPCLLYFLSNKEKNGRPPSMVAIPGLGAGINPLDLKQKLKPVSNTKNPLPHVSYYVILIIIIIIIGIVFSCSLMNYHLNQVNCLFTVVDICH